MRNCLIVSHLFGRFVGRLPLPGRALSKAMSKGLAVFDFDHTIVDDNSDTAVISLVDKSQLPNELKALQRNEGWTAFMQGIFRFLQTKGIDKSSITTLVEGLPAVNGMSELMQHLKHTGYDIIIISDCNSYFIDVWLKKNQLFDAIHKVFTNPAEFVDGLLKIEMFHVQDSCKLSTKNLCKGMILENFIQEQRKHGIIYSNIIYCGDGVNDFCPILRLKEHDLACVRNNYKCLDLINRAKQGECLDHSGNVHTVRAEILVWDTGKDILKHLQKDQH